MKEPHKFLVCDVARLFRPVSACRHCAVVNEGKSEKEQKKDAKEQNGLWSMIVLMAMVITMIVKAMMTMLDAAHDAGYDMLIMVTMMIMMITNAICDDDNGYDD